MSLRPCSVTKKKCLTQIAQIPTDIIAKKIIREIREIRVTKKERSLMQTSATTKASMSSNGRKARNKYKPRTERMAFALAHPHMVEVADAELRARLRSYQK